MVGPSLQSYDYFEKEVCSKCNAKRTVLYPDGIILKS